MTSYDYRNLPDPLEAAALPEELFAYAQRALIQALDSDLIIATEAKAVHVYDRNGYMEADAFGGHQNPSYRGETDDVVLQLTVRVPHPKSYGVADKLNAIVDLEEQATEHALNAEKARLEAQLAKAEKEAAQAETTAREAREKLEALRKK